MTSNFIEIIVYIIYFFGNYLFKCMKMLLLIDFIIINALKYEFDIIFTFYR